MKNGFADVVILILMALLVIITFMYIYKCVKAKTTYSNYTSTEGCFQTLKDGFCLTTCFLTTSLLVRTVWTVSDAIAVPGWLQTFSAAWTPTQRFGKEKSAHIRFGNHSVRVLDGQGKYRMDLRNLFDV